MIRPPPRSTPFLHDALPILGAFHAFRFRRFGFGRVLEFGIRLTTPIALILALLTIFGLVIWSSLAAVSLTDRKSTRLNSSHTVISYAVFCLKKKNTHYCNRL